jgi:hypothetical protein
MKEFFFMISLPNWSLKMIYGYCGTVPDYSWNISHGTIEYGEQGTMLTNVVLSRTRAIKTYGPDSPYKDKINAILCFDNFFVKNFTLTVAAKEIYYWKPKRNSVSSGGVINYNAPCEDGDDAREVNGCKCFFSCEGVGRPSSANMTVIKTTAKSLTTLLGVSTSSSFTMSGLSHQYNLNSWETTTVTGNLESPDNMGEIALTSHSLSATGLAGVNNLYMIMESKTQLFPDQSSTNTTYTSILSTLQSSAGVS